MQGDELIDVIVAGRIDEAGPCAQALLDEGIAAKVIMEKYLIPAMEIVGEKFESQEYFVPEVLVSAHSMGAVLELLEPILILNEEKPLGKVVIGTVKGDVHDIGKNIVAMLLQGAGFRVINLGADVAPETFSEAIKEHGADILGMSSLLTTAMSNMLSTIDILEEEGIRDKVKVMVGGAAITPQFAEKIGADSYGDDANEAVRIAKELVSD